MATSNFNINSNCCPTGAETFIDIYGCQPTGLTPGNLPIAEPTTNLWDAIFCGTDGWWESTSNQWTNPYDTAEQNPRNCINFRNRCPRNDRISLTLAGDCCADICASATEDLDILRTVPKVPSKTVTIMGRKGMCKGSVSPPVSLDNMWNFAITTISTEPHVDLYRYQVSRNGNSWTTLASSYVTTPSTLYDYIFDTDASPCPTSCLCLSGTTDPSTTAIFPDTNAFWAASGIAGQPRQACPPRFCYLRIVGLQSFCIQSFTATYANGGGLCSSFPTCPAGLIYEDRICRPLPARSCPGLAAPQVTGWNDTNPDRPVPPASNDASDNRRLLTISKQIRKQRPGGQSESEHTRNVRALAGPPWNSRATTDSSQGIALTSCGNADCDGYACSMCIATFVSQCGEGCYPNGDPYPNRNGCSNPAFCRRRFARKHQSDDRMLNKLVACAVAACRITGSGTTAATAASSDAPAALTALINKSWSNTPAGDSGCISTPTGAPILYDGKYWVWLYQPGTPTVLFNAFTYDGATWSWYNFDDPPALINLTDPASQVDTSTSIGSSIFFSTASVTFNVLGTGCTFQGTNGPWPVPS